MIKGKLKKITTLINEGAMFNSEGSLVRSRVEYKPHELHFLGKEHSIIEAYKPGFYKIPNGGKGDGVFHEDDFEYLKEDSPKKKEVGVFFTSNGHVAHCLVGSSQYKWFTEDEKWELLEMRL